MKETSKRRKFIITGSVILIVILTILVIESQKPKIQTTTSNEEKNAKYLKAPDFIGIEHWINSDPLTIAQLKGKVVLVDFWTYTCINCIRTIPYLKQWDEKYREKGLVIIGIHTPEFNFEKNYDNVVAAAKKYGIKYAIAQDNEYSTWNAYQNRYWPHEYLVDIDGYIRYDHIGEGNYEESEKMIQALLEEKMKQENKTLSFEENMSKPQEAVNINALKVKTPEIYLGYQFSRGNFGNKEGQQPEQTTEYKIPQDTQADEVYLSGTWKNNADNMELQSETGEILLTFSAKDAHIVAESQNASEAAIFLNNAPVDETNKGMDVIGNKVSIKESRLYNLVSAKDYDTYTLKIEITGKGFKIYTFTFG